MTLYMYLYNLLYSNFHDVYVNCSDGGLETWFYGSQSRLSKVSVSRFKGLARDYSIETTRPEGGK